MEHSKDHLKKRTQNPEEDLLSSFNTREDGSIYSDANGNDSPLKTRKLSWLVDDCNTGRSSEKINVNISSEPKPNIIAPFSADNRDTLQERNETHLISTEKLTALSTCSYENNNADELEKGCELILNKKDAPDSIVSNEVTITKFVSFDNLETKAYEGNTDLNSYSKCQKNSGHKQFYAPDSLQVHDLPSEIQHEHSLTFFHCASQLVVQILVYHTSLARDPLDAYSHLKGTGKKRNGSGFIAAVDSEILKFKCNQVTCPLVRFKEATEVKPPTFSRSFSAPNGIADSISDSSHHYSGIYIHTNKHVIFDKSEADCAIVKFFFNTPDQSKVVYGHVSAIVGVNKNQDHVTLHVMSHERNLLNTVNCLLKDAQSSYRQMVKSTHKVQKSYNVKHNQSWVAVIAHAHGLSKAITFGHIKKEEEDGLRIIKYYDAATCPGCSGGLVMTPSLLELQWPGAVHSCCDSQTGLNVTLDSRVRDLDSQAIGSIHEKLSRHNSDSSCPSIEYYL